MITKEQLIYKLCQEFNVHQSQVEQANIDLLYRFLRQSQVLSLQDFIDHIREIGLKRGLRVFVKPAYTDSFMRFGVRNKIIQNKRFQEAQQNGLTLEHITGYHEDLREDLRNAGIDSVDDLIQKSPCELYGIWGKDWAVRRIVDGLKEYGLKLKKVDCCCMHNRIDR